MPTYDLLADLPVAIDGVRYTALGRDTSSGFPRVSTEITLHGGGQEGVGEDVWVVPEDHAALLAGPPVDLSGAWTLDTLTRRLHEPDLFPDAADPNGPRFRRWGFTSAALDLGLRQAGMTLAQALGRPARPVGFVLSLRLGEPSHIAPLARRLERYPWARLKLDPVNDWTPELVREIAAYGADRVAVLDFKAHYGASPFTPTPDPDLYAMCLEAFPDAWIEDPHLGPETAEVLAPHHDRFTWDAPLHSLGDLLALDEQPRCINVKPCRFGDLPSLMAVYDHCEERGIAMYGGGFFEIGAGRGQIEYLASLFHPDGPNDVAPRGFHWPDPPDGLPASPLIPAAASLGFRWADADPVRTPD